MSYMKRFVDQIMVDMGKEEYDEEVMGEAHRRMGMAESAHADLPDANESFAQFWISYTVRRDGSTMFHKIYDLGHSMKCKWTSFIHDLENSDGDWRIVEESEERKAVAYDSDAIVSMTVFQLVTIKAMVREPEVEVTDQVSVGQCIKDGTHLTDCDDDGFCNYCGEQ